MPTVKLELKTPDELLDEIIRLRKGIKDYLDRNYVSPRESRPGKCVHGIYFYASCGNCIDEHFTKLLAVTN